MIYLLLCIISTSLILILFKYMEKRSIDSFQAIVVNYFAATILGFFTSGQSISQLVPSDSKTMFIGLIVGMLFIVVFIFIAKSTRYAGVSTTTVATKMSVLLPVVFSIIRYNEILNWSKVLGIIVALVALFLTTYKKERAGGNIKALIFPVLIFFGTGIIDTIIKIAQAEIIVVGEVASFNTLVFGVAFLIGLLIVVFSFNKQRRKFNFRVLIYGSILGLVNFGSLYFLINALNHSGLQSSIVFPLNNIGVVILSVSVAVIIFKEKISAIRFAGILVALVAIILLIGI